METLDDLERYLATAPHLYGFMPQVAGGGGHAGKFALVFNGGVAVLCKPASGPGDSGRASKNEVAAWTVARLLGWTDMLAASVLRPIPNPFSGVEEDMALQVLWPGTDFIPDAASFTDEEIWKAALFDYAILHNDRNGNNWLGVPPAALPFPGTFIGHRQQLKLIDHGYAFNYPGRETLNSIFATKKRGESVPPDFIADFKWLAAKAKTSGLAALLESQPLVELVTRVTAVINGGTIP